MNKIFSLTLLIIVMFGLGLASTQTIPVHAVNTAADCSDTAPSENTSYLKCNLQIFGVRCFFPTNCVHTEAQIAATGSGGQAALYADNYKYSVVGALIDVTIYASPFLAVMVIFYAAYQYYIGAFIQDQKKGMESVRVAVIGLALTSIVPLIKVFVFKFDGTEITLNDGPTNVVNKIVLNFLAPTITLMIYASATFAVISLIYGAYKYIMGGRDGITEGTEILKNSLIGLLVALLGASLVGLIQNVFTGL